MAAIAVTTFTAAPGKMAAAQGLLKEATDIWRGQGAGAEAYALARGATPGLMTAVVEYADPVDYGAALDRVYAHPDWHAYLARAQQSQALVPVASTDYREVPALEVPHGEIAGLGVAQATLFTIRHGKQASSLERIRRVKAIVEKHGGRMRALLGVVSEPFGLSALVTYHADFAAWAKAGAALNADPEWQAFGEETARAEANVDFIRSSVMRRL